MPISNSTSFNAWKIHGNDYSEPEWKADGVVSYDGFGLMTFRGTLQVKDTEDLASTKGCPVLGQDLGGAAAGFFVSKINKKLQVNKSVLFDIEAIGIEARCNGITRINATPSTAMSTEPIESHPGFENIAGTPDAPLNGAVFDDKKKFLGFGVVKQSSSGPRNDSITSSQSLAGVRSYYSPKQVFRGYFHAIAKVVGPRDYNRLMETPVSNTGEIASVKLVPDWMYYDKEATSWMLTSISPEPIVVDEDGNPIIIKVSYELLKAPRQWNPLIYLQVT